MIDSVPLEIRLNDALEAAGMAWWEIEMPTGAVFFAENKTKMLGYKKKDFFHYSNFTDLLHPDDYDTAMQAMKDHLEGRAEVYETQYRIKAKDGSYKVFYDKGKIVQNRNGEIRIAGVVVNVEALQKLRIANQ